MYFKHLVLFVDFVGILSTKFKSFVAPVQVVWRSMSKPRKLILFHEFTTIDIIYYIANSYPVMLPQIGNRQILLCHKIALKCVTATSVGKEVGLVL